MIELRFSSESLPYLIQDPKLKSFLKIMRNGNKNE